MVETERNSTVLYIVFQSVKNTIYCIELRDLFRGYELCTIHFIDANTALRSVSYICA